VLGLSAAVLLAGVFGAWQWTASHREPVEQTVRFPFVMGANERDLPVSPLAVSPDGSTIVYGASSAGQSLLLVRGLDQLTSRPLPGTDGGAQVTFSPDGEWIAFAAQGQLKKIQISGGAVITLASPLGTISGLTWPRPELIVLSMNDRLMTLPATGGTPKALTQDDSASGEHGQRGPKAIGDDNWVAYNSWRGSLNESRLALVSLETGETEVLDILGAAPIGLLDGQMLYGSVSGSIMAVPFDVRTRKPTGAPVPVIDQYQMPLTGATRASLSRTGTLVYRTGTSTNQVVLADMRGAPKPLIADPKGYSFPRFSPDGKRLAISVTTLGLTDVWIYDIASGTPTRLTNGGTQNERPEWSPDGKRVFFQSNRTGRAALWAQSSDFSGEAQLIESVADGQVPEAVVSPDGAFVLFRSTGGGKQQDLTYRRLTGDTTRKPFVTSPFNDYGPRFSPDGKWVAYMSNQDGANQIYVQGFPEGARHKVTAAGGTAPVWSPDGKRIYYQSDNRLWVATVTTSPSFAVTSRDSLLEGNYELTVPVHANYDVTPDGKNFVLLRRSSSDNPIIVVTGWRRELRARTTVKR
jgi:serine/threonine-protein kinase